MKVWKVISEPARSSLGVKACAELAVVLEGVEIAVNLQLCYTPCSPDITEPGYNLESIFLSKNLVEIHLY